MNWLIEVIIIFIAIWLYISYEKKVEENNEKFELLIARIKDLEEFCGEQGWDHSDVGGGKGEATGARLTFQLIGKRLRDIDKEIDYLKKMISKK